MKRNESLLLDTIDFFLPPELEAHEPPEARGVARDHVRLLVTRNRGRRIDHARFDALPDFLEPGDLLVANDSAMLPASLNAQRADGSVVRLHLSTQLADGLWVVEPRHAPVTAGETLTLPGGAAAAFVAPHAESRRLWVARLETPVQVLDYLMCWGKPISYPYVQREWPLAMYQTTYAHEPGSAEMPSAGRAFTPAVLERLRECGIGFATLTLHTGVASLETPEPPYAERYVVPPETATAVNVTREAGRRVIAVGTTVVRALESATETQQGRSRVVPAQGWTDLVVTPQRGVRVIDGLLTGFHEPRATHLAMLEAIAGRNHLEAAYEAALRDGYLWHEFGDLHLLLP